MQSHTIVDPNYGGILILSIIFLCNALFKRDLKVSILSDRFEGLLIEYLIP